MRARRTIVMATMAAGMAAMAACSGGGGTARPVGPTAPAGGGGDAGGAEVVEAPIERDVEAAPPAAPAPAPISREECGQLVDRMIAIELAEHAAREPHAPQLTAEQQAHVRARLLDEALQPCATMPRATWQCAIAAGDRAAMAACDDAGP